MTPNGIYIKSVSPEVKYEAIRAVGISAPLPKGRCPNATIFPSRGFAYWWVPIEAFFGPIALLRFEVSKFPRLVFHADECDCYIAERNSDNHYSHIRKH